MKNKKFFLLVSFSILFLSGCLSIPVVQKETVLYSSTPLKSGSLYIDSIENYSLKIDLQEKYLINLASTILSKHDFIQTTQKEVATYFLDIKIFEKSYSKGLTQLNSCMLTIDVIENSTKKSVGEIIYTVDSEGSFSSYQFLLKTLNRIMLQLKTLWRK